MSRDFLLAQKMADTLSREDSKSLTVSCTIAVFAFAASLISVVAALIARWGMPLNEVSFYVIINGMIAPAYLLSWMLLRIRFSLSPRLIILGVALFQITVVVFAGGIMNGTALYYFSGVAAPFMIFTQREKWLRIPFIGSSVVLFLYAGFVFLVEKRQPLLTGLPAEGPVFNAFQFMNASMAFAVLGMCVYYFYRAGRLAEEKLDEERRRSQDLLLNILPAPVAARLMGGETLIADRYPMATVLFADIVGFTPLSARLPPEELLGLLNDVFSGFDELAEKLDLEKIKTIGDAYMAVGGVPRESDDHAVSIARLGLGMIQLVEEWSGRMSHPIEVRIGIHSGPVVAGVIGRRKFIYDLWGDTVNTASRMESHGLPGRVHLSQDTRLLIGDAIAMERRGPIEVKGKGSMETFFLVNHPKP